MSSTEPLLLEGSPAIVAVVVRPVDGRLELMCGGSLFSLSSKSAIAYDAIQFAAQQCKIFRYLVDEELSVGRTKSTSRSSKTPSHSARYISVGVLDVGSHRCNCAIIADSGSSRQFSSTQRRSDPDHRRVRFTPDSPESPEPVPGNERGFILVDFSGTIYC